MSNQQLFFVMLTMKTKNMGNLRFELRQVIYIS